jgi:hypothetical protein
VTTYTIARTNEPRFNVEPAQWVCSECGAVVEQQARHDAFHVRLSLLGPVLHAAAPSAAPDPGDPTGC